MLRGASGCLTREATVYAPPELHHVATVPTFEKHARTVREMLRGKVVARTVEKIRYRPDGKTPAKLLVNEKGEPLPEMIPISKPRRLKAGSPRRVYKTLKQLHRTVGLDRVFKELQLEAAA